MPKFKKHLQINFLAIGAMEVSAQLREIEANPALDFDWARFLVNVGTGAIAGALPDILEPSLGNPNHRGFCHSLGAAIIVWWLVSGRHTSDLPVATKRLLTAVGIGYSAHLCADLFLTKAKGIGLLCAKF